MKKINLAIPAGLLLLVSACGVAMAAPAAPFFARKQILGNGTQYLTGGVGIDERKQLQRIEGDYNLKLIFDVDSGAYLSFVEVNLNSDDGRVRMDATSLGPWFYSQVPAGKYRVTATHQGHKQVREVVVGPGLKTVVFSWKG